MELKVEYLGSVYAAVTETPVQAFDKGVRYRGEIDLDEKAAELTRYQKHLEGMIRALPLTLQKAQEKGKSSVAFVESIVNQLLDITEIHGQISGYYARGEED